MTCAPTKTPDDIDIPALREKYRHERDKRLRPEGAGQYVEATAERAHYYEDDPYAPISARAPVSEEIDVAILGGGFAGLIAAARIKESGITNLRVIEMGGDFGGTWYWNRYPGVQCDIESYSYLPLLEELKYVPKERYSFGPEIYEHCQRIGQHYGLYEQALFGTIIRSLRWDEKIKRWRVGTNHNDDIRARFVVMAFGLLNKPKLPGIPDLENFKGRTFHTARWDYDYTGGGSTGGLVKLRDKRVAVIGTGATAIQCVPFLGRDAKHLYVFQRTPSSVDERGNRPTDPEWAKSLGRGWQKARQTNFHASVYEGFASPEDDLICDNWGIINRNLAATLSKLGNPKLTPEQLEDMRELEDYKAMERIRRRVDSIVTNKETAEALKPYYRFLCKRPCFNDDYLPTFNRQNVTLVDVSASKGVERVTEDSIIANGTEYKVDCIIFASGFEITNDLRRRYGIDVIEGRNSQSLYDHWGKGFQTLHGMTTHGFPNLFFIGYSQVGMAAVITTMYQQQANHVAYIMTQTLSQGAAAMAPSQQAEDDWSATINQASVTNPRFWRECTPGYINNEGTEVGASFIFGDPYGPGYHAFDELLRDWRSTGTMEGLVLEKASSAKIN